MIDDPQSPAYATDTINWIVSVCNYCGEGEECVCVCGGGDGGDFFRSYTLLILRDFYSKIYRLLSEGV